MKTLNRARELRPDEGGDADPAALVFTATALHQLGREDEAKATPEQLRTLARDEQFVEGEETRVLLAEAERLIVGRGQ